MATNLWLTDTASDIDGYLLARLGSRSDIPSLIRSVTNTEAGPSSGVQITRTAGGTALAWLTQPLDGTDLTAAAWTVNVWAKESAAAANAALRIQVLPYTTSEQAAALDNNVGTELSTTMQNVAITTGVASITTMADGDRLVIKLLIDDAGTMGASQTVTVAYNGQNARSEGDSYLVCPDTLVVTAAIPTATVTHVRRHLRDTSATNPLLATAEIEQAITAAIGKYSEDRPLEVAGFLSGDGAAYAFRLPRQWVWGFSRLLQIEYPVGETPRSYLEQDDQWAIVVATLGTQPTRQLEFVATPGSGTDNLLLSYTTRHTHTDEMDTIPAGDFEAVTWLAASFAAQTAAAREAGSSDSTVTADAVNYRDGEQRWGSVAKRFRALYDEAIRGDGKAAAASLMRDWDVNLAGGRDRIFHGRRWR